MPSPAMKACASARLNLSAIRCASQPSTSNARVVEQPLDRLRQRDELVQRDRDAVDLRRAGLGLRPGLGRPAGADVGMVDQHVEGARLHRHHVGDGPDRGRRPQHADDLARRHAGRPDSRRPPPPRSTAPSPRRSGRAARRRRPTADRRRTPSCAASRSRRPRASGGRFIAMDLRSSMARRVSCSWSFALISDWKALNSLEKPGQGGLDLHLRARTRRGSPRPGFAFSFLHRLFP